MRRAAVLLGLLCAVAPALLAQGTPGRQPARPPDISGFWELSFDSRKVPQASLLPAVTRARIDARAKADAHAIRWCNLLGMPFLMDSGRPLDIRVGATAVILVPENSSAPRYLYLNRTTHIGNDIFDPSTNGDSIARWEGDTLVVDTVGFHGERGNHDHPGRRVSNGNIASRRTVPVAQGRRRVVGDVYVDRSESVSHAAHVRVPLQPAARELRGADVGAMRSL